jgi:hypothetical protein
VLGRESTESARDNFFLAVFEENGLVDHGVDFTLKFKRDLLASDRLSDGNSEEVTLANFVSKGLGVEHLEELKLVHEAVEGRCPSVTNGLEELGLDFAQLDRLESLGFLCLFISRGADEAADNTGGIVDTEDT